MTASTALIAACQRLILGGGMAPATTADLERAAAVSPGELHRHFASREALIDAALASIKRTLLAPPMQASASRTPIAAVARRSRAQAGAERRAGTRRALIEAGKRLVGAGHIDAASVDVIVREAGVGKGSFFNHFASREALVRTVMATVRDELEAAIVAGTRDINDPAARLAHRLVIAWHYRIEQGLGARVILAIDAKATDTGAPANALLKADLQAGIDAGVLRIPGMDSGLAVVLGMSELGLLRLMDDTADTAGAVGLMQALCVTMLGALGVDARRHARLAREAVHAMSAPI